MFGEREARENRKEASDMHIHRAMGNGNAAHRERVDGMEWNGTELNSRAAQEVIRGAAAAASGDGFD